MTEKQLERLKFALESDTGFTPCEVFTGEGCDISGKCSIGRSGFGFARNIDGRLVKIWHHGDIKIGDDCVIRDFVTIDRATVKGSLPLSGTGTSSITTAMSLTMQRYKITTHLQRVASLKVRVKLVLTTPSEPV